MTRSWLGRHGAVMAAAAICVAAGLAGGGGCQLAGLLGEGKEKALHQIEKGTKVLVLVDVDGGVGVPPSFATTLADQIGIHLVKEEAVTVPVVSQEAVIKLQQANPEAYKKMGVADIALAAGADQVLVVRITRMDTPREESGLVTKGHAVANVKIIDKAGQRVWPADAAGQEITADVKEALVTDKNLEQVQKEIGEQLALRTGRMFHAYEVEGHFMDR